MEDSILDKRPERFKEEFLREDLDATSAVVYPKPVDATDTAINTLPYTSSMIGCSESFEELIVFHRAEFNRLMSYLDDLPEEGHFPVIIIEGPPGCGKSTTAWQWFLLSAKTNPHLHMSWITTYNDVITLHEGMKTEADYSEGSVEGSAFLFIDGVTHNTLESWRQLIFKAYKTRKQVVLVSSMQLPDIKLKKQDRFLMNAWTLDEYQSACSHEPFFKQVLRNLLSQSEVPKQAYTIQEKEDLVERKYGIAGHSARWLFDTPFDKVMAIIDRKIEQIGDIQLFFNPGVGERSNATVNSLSLSDPVNSTRIPKIFTSAYVARALGRRLSSSDIARLHRLVHVYGGSAMQGYAVEIDFIETVCKKGVAGRVQYVIEPSTSSTGRAVRAVAAAFDPTFNAPRCQPIFFYRDTLYPQPDAVLLRLIVSLVGTWYLPKVLNRGGFDAIQLIDVDGVSWLRFVNLTVQLARDINFDFMRIFLVDFNQKRADVGLCEIVDVELILMLPEDLALLSQPPEKWNVRGLQRGTPTSVSLGAKPLNVVKRVACFTITTAANINTNTSGV